MYYVFKELNRNLKPNYEIELRTKGVKYKMAFEYLAQYITFDSVADMDKSVEDTWRFITTT